MQTLALLVVEDDPGYVELVRTWLLGQTLPYRISLTHVETLAEAVELIEAGEDFSGIALDLFLPDVPDQDPTAGVRALRSIDGCPPIVAMTSFSPAFGQTAVQAGAFAFVAKSTDNHAALIDAVASASARRERESDAELLARVKRQKERLRRVTRVLAHDLITPVAIAISAIETVDMLISRERTDLVAPYLDLARSRLQQLSDDMNQVLDETLDGQAEALPVDVTQAVQLALGNLRRDDRERLHLIIEEGPAVHTLPGTMRQIMTNLLTNAARHNEGAVAITIRSVAHGDRVRVIIDDNGRGWQDDPAELVAEGASTGGSTGIGLMTIVQAVESMGGEVNFGHAPNRGVRIVLDLPAAEPGAAADPSDSEALSPRS